MITIILTTIAVVILGVIFIIGVLMWDDDMTPEEKYKRDNPYKHRRV